MLDRLVGRIIGQVERRQYTLTTEGDANRTYLVARADVRVGNKVYPCDTSIDVESGQSRDSAKATFATLIHDGVSGENKAPFDEVIKTLNHSFPGKFACDVSDDTHDILYTTSERLSSLNSKIIIENLEHHAQVKAQVTPELEHLIDKLGLKPKGSLTQAEQFAKDWDKVFKGTTNLPQGPEITYLPEGKKK